MGKRRNGAKTGDKKLYSSRNARKEASDRNPQGVDSFHRGREENFLALDSNAYSADDDEQFETRQNVLDLAFGDGESIEESEDSIGEEAQKEEFIARSSPSLAGSSEDSIDNDDETQSLDQLDARYWGRKKSAYYDGDLGDLELGVQAEDDAFVEEEAARKVQASRWNEMQEDDFVPSDDEDQAADEFPQVPSRFATVRDTVHFSTTERRKLLKVQHPELLPVASYFAEIWKEYLHTTKVASDAIIGKKELDKETAKIVGASRQGQQLLLTKSLTELSAVLNTVLYLLIKSSMSERDDPEAAMLIGTHPVMLQLKRSNAIAVTLSDTVVKSVHGLEDQIQHLIHAANLLSKSNERDDFVDFEQVAVHGVRAGGIGFDLKCLNESALPDDPAGKELDDSSVSRTVDDARFGLRQHEVQLENVGKGKRRKVPVFSDFCIETEEVRNPKGLSSVINAIDQRASKRTPRSQGLPFVQDEEYFDDEVAVGVRMMEAELEDTGDGGAIPGNWEDFDDRQNAEAFDVADFYGKMANEAKKKRQLKKENHMVAPKFPTFEGEVEGERAISRAMLKNRGLVPHKNRSNRNPRVKNRVRYQQALERRRGAVREIRTDEGRYEGEGTGIKSTISRSKKLIS